MIDITAHVIFSLLIGFSFWIIFDGKRKRTLYGCLFFALLSGVFVDIDHLFDYYKTYGFDWSIKKFFAEDYFFKTNYVLFHGYEYVIVLELFAYFVKNKTKKLFFMVLSASLFMHLIIDTVLSNSSIQSYFLCYRIFMHFRAM